VSAAGTLGYFQERVSLTPSGCAEWTGYLTADGYGKAVVGYRGHGRPIRKYAHRVMFEWWIGPVPKGLELDHLCRNRRCINPLHLEPVTRAENVRRGDVPTLMRDSDRRPRRGHVERCKHGHEMVGDNVGTNAQRRWCRACRRDIARRAYERSKQMDAKKNGPAEIRSIGAQGDVLFRRVTSVPSGAAPVKPEDGRLVVGHSETGHHHAVDDLSCFLFQDPRSPLVGYLQLGDACAAGGGVDVVHHRPWDTHKTLRLLGQPGDVFEIRRQREWAPEGWRRVAD